MLDPSHAATAVDWVCDRQVTRTGPGCPSNRRSRRPEPLPPPPSPGPARATSLTSEIQSHKVQERLNLVCPKLNRRAPELVDILVCSETFRQRARSSFMICKAEAGNANVRVDRLEGRSRPSVTLMHMSNEPPFGSPPPTSLYIGFNDEQNAVFLVMGQPEDVGGEEAMDEAVAQHGLEHEKRIAQGMGPEVLQWILPVTGATLVGIAAVINAWCRRHRDALVSMSAGVGPSFELRGKPAEAVSDEQIQEMLDRFTKAVLESIEADDNAEQGESDGDDSDT
jgi:hypothetical protein